MNRLMYNLLDIMDSIEKKSNKANCCILCGRYGNIPSPHLHEETCEILTARENIKSLLRSFMGRWEK